MRIAYICADPGIPVFGRKGASIHVQEVLRGLRQQGAAVELFATRFDGAAPPDLQDIPLHPLPPIGKGEIARREQSALAANHELRAALRRAGQFDLIYERYSLWSFAGMETARARGVPGLLEVNAPLIEEQARHRGLVHRAAAEQVASRAFGAASALLAVSDGVADYLAGCAQTRVEVVPNGVNPQRFPANIRPARPLRPDEFTVGFVGTLKPWHGLETLTESFAALHRQHPAARLLIVGDGPQRQTLRDDLAARGLAHAVHFTGAVAPADVPAWLASMNVAVAPYPNLPHFYFSPLKLFEYMAAGLSVVASRIGQIATIIDNGVTGLLCQPGNPHALTESLLHLHAHPHLCHQMGQAARNDVLARYTWEAVTRRIMAVAGLETVAGGRSV
ncbi:MAG: glycosyltransferase family 4 protein [Anaerolineae bacterium]